MKLRILTLIPILLVLAIAPAVAGNIEIEHEGFEMDFENGTLVVSSHDRHSEEVEITEDLELYVDGKKIDTDRKDRKLLEAYYETAQDVEKVATELGLEGARLGVEGAALGIQAISKVIKLLDSDYDIDDLEEEIEAEAAKIEAEAEDIEEQAEEIEEAVDEMMKIGDKLQDRIPELEDLDWF